MNNNTIFVQWNSYQCEVQCCCGTEQIAEFLKNKKRLLGKGSLEISMTKTHLPCTEYSIELFDSEQTRIEKTASKAVLYGAWEEISRTETLECLLLLCFERQMQLDGIVSVHASGVVFNNECYLFLGAREAGKTTAAYSICKELNAELACNDYICLKEINGQVLAYNGDGKDELAFRSHALIQMDEQLFETVYGSEYEGRVNVRKKVSIKDLGICTNQGMVPVKRIFLLGLGHTPKLECNVEEPIKAMVSLYENFCGLIRGNELILYASNKQMGGFLPDFSCRHTHSKVHEVIKKLIDAQKVYNLRGPLEGILEEMKSQFKLID